MPDAGLTPQLTADCSFTFFCEAFGEAFHSHYGARQEAQQKFVGPCQLAEKAQAKSSLRLLDICYGLGYNSAAALETIWAVNPHCRVEWIGLEFDPAVPQQATAQQLLHWWHKPIPQLLKTLAQTHQVETPQLQAKLLIGDARATIQPLSHSGFEADAIFLDPFSPPKCPQLWTVEFLAFVTRCLQPMGKLATYSCAASVRTALASAGLKMGSTTAVGRRSPGTVASFSSNNLLPLSQQEQEHLRTRAAIPYHDPQLSDSAEIILQRREKEQQASALEPTTHWKKRWFNKDEG
jgi:tRNA U34 5-methylaminomethyl-2-thiouridine-forming methyltransferase MnmC